MSDGDRFWALFFELYEGLPRQGPGNRATAERALALCTDLPHQPTIIDLGCGSGGQTLHLAALTDGHITGIDTHEPLVTLLQARIQQHGLADRITAKVADIGAPTFAPATADLLWSEGALYNIGIDTALRLYFEVAKPGGYFVFTDAVWLTDEAPPEVRKTFDEYPGMGSVEDLLSIIARSRWTLVDHFLLPEQAWWDDFYTPMEERIESMRAAYSGDGEALAILDELAQEPAMYREHAATFGYEFFVLQRPRTS